MHRNLNARFQNHLSKYPILALTGPRQSGKTTLLKNVLKDYTYVNLENPDVRQFAKNDPNAFLEQYPNKIIFDEVQRVPELFSYLQGIVDENQIMGQFILSGSQNFQLMENITQSLAGRVSIFKLYPFDIDELQNSHWLKQSLSEQMFTGGYPAIYDRNIPPADYYENYLETYIQRDVSTLQNIQDLVTFN